MQLDRFRFGSVRIDGVVYDKDLVIDRGEVSKRKKKRSKPFRAQFGHTPLSLAEKIPWKCRTLLIGTGASGGLPIMKEVGEEAERRRVELRALTTPEAIEFLNRNPKRTNAVLHLTC